MLVHINGTDVWIQNGKNSIVVTTKEAAQIANEIIRLLERHVCCPYTEVLREQVVGPDPRTAGRTL